MTLDERDRLASGVIEAQERVYKIRDVILESLRDEFHTKVLALSFKRRSSDGAMIASQDAVDKFLLDVANNTAQALLETE